MTEATARTVLLVKAIEQHDDKAEIISRHQRHQAGRSAESASQSSGAPASPVPDEDFLAKRAQVIFDELLPKHPALGTAQTATTWRTWITPSIATAAFLLGLASNTLGPEKRINILAFPLLGMLCWNVLVYLVLIAERLGIAQKSQGSSRPQPFLHVMRWVALPMARMLEKPHGLWPALQAYTQEWLRVSAPLQLARTKLILHLGAAMLAAGTVAGMYWRGLAFEYRAGWESTFLNAGQVHQLLQVVLGPASLITGIALPSPIELEAIRWPNEGENAANWINLYAVTAGLFICAPRLIMAQLNAHRARRLASAFPLPLDDPYFKRVNFSGPLLRDNAWIIPCGVDLQTRQLEALRDFLHGVFGLNANLRFETSVAYGSEDDFLERARLRPNEELGHLFIIFNMAATPEAEHQGRLLQGLKSLRGPAHPPPIALLDESSYRRRLTGAAESENQIEKRRKTWQRLARDHNVVLLTLDLDAPDPDYWYEQLQRALAQDQSQPRPA